jgi:hypothetical protein
LLRNALRRRGISPHLFPAGEPGLQYEATSMSDRRPRDHVHGGSLWSRLLTSA